MKQVNKYPPGPKDVFPFALSRKFLRDPLKTLTNLAQNYGCVSHFKFGKLNIYFLNHPEYIEDVLVTNCCTYIDG